MSGTRQLLPILGLLATMGWTSYMVVQLGAQEPSGSFNFANAAFAEVRDEQGQVVLRGEFAVDVDDDDDDDVERKAMLKPAGADADAAGEVEVEVSKAAQADQDLEVSVRNVQPGARLTLAIDGQDVATVVADRRGRIELERRVRSGHLQ